MTTLLSKQDFLDKVFNFEQSQDWDLKGDLPVIIDFYADWCGPCKMIAPVLEELSEEYQDRVIIYKVDTEKEQELAAAFGVRSIPSILFCPQGEQPQMAQGALPKQEFKQLFKDILKVEEA